MINKTGIIIINYNQKELTTKLCDIITSTVKSEYIIIVVETGSKRDNQTIYPTISLPDGVRMTFGINEGIQYLIRREKLQNEYYLDTFWILVNDTELNPKIDTLTPMVEYVRKYNIIGEIHPAIENSPSKILRPLKIGDIRNESFCEIVCPLFSRKAIELNLFDEKFIYGWGLDFSIPYILHKNKLKLYICDEVSIIHNAGTTTRNGKDNDFKTMEQQFNKSRQNMIEVLELKYGKFWYKVIREAIPNDVRCDAYVDWITNIGQNCKYEDLF